MLLYHGSDVEVKCPDTLHSKGTAVLGRGFYLYMDKQSAMCRGKFASVFHYSHDVNVAEERVSAHTAAGFAKYLSFIVDPNTIKGDVLILRRPFRKAFLLTERFFGKGNTTHEEKAVYKKFLCDYSPLMLQVAMLLNGLAFAYFALKRRPKYHAIVIMRSQEAIDKCLTYKHIISR